MLDEGVDQLTNLFLCVVVVLPVLLPDTLRARGELGILVDAGRIQGTDIEGVVGVAYLVREPESYHRINEFLVRDVEVQFLFYFVLETIGRPSTVLALLCDWDIEQGDDLLNELDAVHFGDTFHSLGCQLSVLAGWCPHAHFDPRN